MVKFSQRCFSITLICTDLIVRYYSIIKRPDPLVILKVRLSSPDFHISKVNKTVRQRGCTHRFLELNLLEYLP